MLCVYCERKECKHILPKIIRYLLLYLHPELYGVDHANEVNPFLNFFCLRATLRQRVEAVVLKSVCPALPRGTSDEPFHGCAGLAIHKIQILARIYNGGHEAFCICKLHRTVRAKYKPWRWTPSSVTGRTSSSTDTDMGTKSSRIRGHVGVIGVDERFVGLSEPATLCSSFCDTETISRGGNDPGSPALLSVVVEIRLLLLQP